MIVIKQAFDLFDIWRVRQQKSARFTFRKNHVKDYIQRRLDFFCFKYATGMDRNG